MQKNSTPYYLVCATCGIEFRVYHCLRNTRKYCSMACVIQARAKRYGPSRTIPLADRFWVKVKKSEGCWEWVGNKDRCGYGRTSKMVSGTRMIIKAHRAAYELTYGEIPEGMLVCHHCDNPSCVRPDHLFIGTRKDNTQDMMKKGRGRGGRETNAKLSMEKAKDIRRRHAAGERVATIASYYGVDRRTISMVLQGITWK